MGDWVLRVNYRRHEVRV